MDSKFIENYILNSKVVIYGKPLDGEFEILTTTDLFPLLYNSSKDKFPVLDYNDERPLYIENWLLSRFIHNFIDGENDFKYPIKIVGKKGVYNDDDYWWYLAFEFYGFDEFKKNFW